MPRPKSPRRLRFKPNVYYFKPQGIPLRQLKEVNLESDELEAIKLHHLDGLDQTQSAKRMKISQPTFARIIAKADSKIALAIISGKAIRINQIK